MQEFCTKKEKLLTFHDENALLPSRIHDLLRFLGVDGEGLLAQHVLAGRDGVEAVLLVQRVRRADVHDVDVGIVVDALVVRVDLRAGLVGRLGPDLVDEGVALVERRGAERGDGVPGWGVGSGGQQVAGEHC